MISTGTFSQNKIKNSVTLFSCLFLTAMLSACGGKETKKIEESAKVEPADNAIILSPDGIGPINATTSFNMHQMTLAFNQYSVVEEVNYVKGKPFPAIRVSEGVNTLMNIIPDASRPLGTSYSEVYTYGQQQACQPGAEDLAGKMLCYAPNHPNILYVFNGLWDGAGNGKIPPADILQGWGLETIIWRPKS